MGIDRILKLRGVFVGSGSDGMTDPGVCRRVVSLVSEERRAAPRVVYLGTATYDLPGPAERQTNGLKSLGCTITPLEVALKTPSADHIKAVIDAADVVVVSGGNSLYAVDRWKALNIHTHLAAAAARGCVLTGGSAGALCWFDGGHSDSADPATYAAAMVGAKDTGKDEALAGAANGAPVRQWEYIRVDGLGFLPGLVCPHYDVTQSNGVLRATDFERLMRTSPAERGIGIDHWAALVLPGDGRYEVFKVEGKERVGGGEPGVYVVEVEGAGAGGVDATEGKVAVCKVTESGPLTDIIREPRGGVGAVVNNEVALAACRGGNPPPAV